MMTVAGCADWEVKEMTDPSSAQMMIAQTAMITNRTNKTMLFLPIPEDLEDAAPPE